MPVTNWSLLPSRRSKSTKGDALSFSGSVSHQQSSSMQWLLLRAGIWSWLQEMLVIMQTKKNALNSMNNPGEFLFNNSHVSVSSSCTWNMPVVADDIYFWSQDSSDWYEAVSYDECGCTCHEPISIIFLCIGYGYLAQNHFFLLQYLPVFFVEEDTVVNTWLYFKCKNYLFEFKNICMYVACSQSRQDSHVDSPLADDIPMLDLFVLVALFLLWCHCIYSF